MNDHRSVAQVSIDPPKQGLGGPDLAFICADLALLEG